MVVRNESIQDYRKVEELTREAFWNVQVPGCDEHYLVNQMRNHEDFLPELSFVMEQDGEIVANVMYTKTTLVSGDGHKKAVLSFGPLSVDPKYQRRGYGRKILEHSFTAAQRHGYDTVVIFGAPHNYFCHGFKNACRYDVSLEGGVVPTGMLVKELVPGVLSGKKWTFYGSTAHEVDETKVEEFDKTFVPKIKEYKPSQELFYTFTRSFIKVD